MGNMKTGQRQLAIGDINSKKKKTDWIERRMKFLDYRKTHKCGNTTREIIRTIYATQSMHSYML